MATIDDAIASFQRLESALPAILLAQTEVAAMDIVALVDQRVTETGTTATGGKFEDYTQAYKKRKKALGRYRGHVDFMLSGQMFASTSAGLKNIVPTSKSVTGSRAVVVIGPRDSETRNKIEGNEKKRPGFLNPSQAEVRRVEKIRTERIEDQMRDQFFSDL